MSFDFSALLVLLTVGSGLIWGIDAWLLAPGRKAAIEQEQAEQGGDAEVPVLVEYARSFFPVFLIVLILRSFIVEPFRIPSASMMPTLLIGDFILVNKYEYGIRLPVINTEIVAVGEPARGDIAVFRYPKQPDTPYIKRIVGLPGDHISYRNKQLYINGKLMEQETLERYHMDGTAAGMNGAVLRRENLMAVEHHILIDPGRAGFMVDSVVPEGHYFAMGDNRDHSSDSRFWGFVPEANLVGRAFFIWMNWDSGVNWHRLGIIE
ncbi:MAG: signal peptidase I [Gammaproteobacteria bacterium]|nr:signal peptidase I [Gammaproteobacteria bacterium]